jgi:hypothetical protein
MISIVDSSSEQQCDFDKNIDRAIYTRLQSVSLFPLGSLYKDNTPPISTYIEMSEQVKLGLITSTEADIFLGTLGVTMIYPHRDNIYTGVLQ